MSSLPPNRSLLHTELRIGELVWLHPQACHIVFARHSHEQQPSPVEYINHKQSFLSAVSSSPRPTLPLLLFLFRGSFCGNVDFLLKIPGSWFSTRLRLKCWWGRMCQAGTALCSLSRQQRSSLGGFQGDDSGLPLPHLYSINSFYIQIFFFFFFNREGTMVLLER